VTVLPEGTLPSTSDQRLQPAEHDRPSELPQLVWVLRAVPTAERVAGDTVCNNATVSPRRKVAKNPGPFFDRRHFVIYIHGG
jgi:hypothetical protein